jgi:hypothetical protein
VTRSKADEIRGLADGRKHAHRESELSEEELSPAPAEVRTETPGVVAVPSYCRDIARPQTVLSRDALTKRGVRRLRLSQQLGACCARQRRRPFLRPGSRQPGNLMMTEQQGTRQAPRQNMDRAEDARRTGRERQEWTRQSCAH